jgi:ribosomal protein L11
MAKKVVSHKVSSLISSKKNFSDTSQISVPKELISQVVGQSESVKLIRKAAGIEKGSGKNVITKVGKITEAQALEIAKKKGADLNAKDDQGAINIVAGSARSMGIEVI